MKRKFCLILAVLLCLAGCGSTSQPPELLEPVNVGSDLAPAEIGSIYNGTVWEGVLRPETEELCFSANGSVGEVCVTLGDSVKKGDPLVKLDTVSLQKLRDDLAEQLEYARKIDEFDSSEADLNRSQLADQAGAYSAAYRLYDNEQAAAASRRAAHIADLEKQLKEADEDLTVESVITAPFDGTVVAVDVKVGDPAWPEKAAVVVANDKTCFMQTEFIGQTTIDLATSLYITVEGVRYDVTYVPMKTEDYLTKTLSGATMYSTFALEKPKPELIGQYALLYLMTTEKEQVLNIPANALIKDAGGYYVYVDQNGEKLRRDVEVGLRTTAQAEILSGLKEGENVYVGR